MEDDDSQKHQKQQKQQKPRGRGQRQAIKYCPGGFGCRLESCRISGRQNPVLHHCKGTDGCRGDKCGPSWDRRSPSSSPSPPQRERWCRLSPYRPGEQQRVIHTCQQGAAEGHRGGDQCGSGRSPRSHGDVVENYYNVAEQLGMERSSLLRMLQLNCAGKPNLCRGDDCDGFCLFKPGQYPQ